MIGFAAASLRLHLEAYADGADGSLSDIDARLCDYDDREVVIEAADSKGRWVFARYMLAAGEAFDRDAIIDAMTGRGGSHNQPNVERRTGGVAAR